MSIAKNIFSNWTNIFLSIISVFILFPLMTKVLGEEQYGIWLYISSITGYFSLLQLGVPLANVRFLSKFFASNKPEKMNEVLSSNLFFFSLVGFFIGITGIVFSLFIEHFFTISPAYVLTAKIAMVLATVNVSISFVIELFQGVMFAMQKFIHVNIIKNISIITKLCLFYFLISHDNGLITISLILIGLTAFQGISILILAKMNFMHLKISFSYIKKSVFMEVTKYSLFVMLLQIAGMISFQTDAIVIGSFVSVAAIIPFSIAGNILTYLMQFVIGISSALMPKISALDAVADTTAISDAYRKYSRLTFLLVLPICLFLMISGGDFIAIWMGEKYRESSSNILIILTVSYLFLLVQRGVAFPIFMGTSKMRFLSLLMIGTSILNLGLSIWWGILYGLPGVAWGTTVPNLITVIGIIWFMNRNFGVDLYRYTFESIFTPLIVSPVFVLPLFGLKKFLPQNTYPNILISFLLPFLMYSLLVWVHLLKTEALPNLNRKETTC